MNRKYSFWTFIFVLIFSPLAFGTVEQWALAIMEGLSILALLLLLGGAGNESAPFYKAPGMVPLLCLWGYYLLQLLPLPVSLVRILSPETYRLYTETVGTVAPLSWVSLTMQKKETLLEFFRFTASGLFYVLTVQLLADRTLLKKTVFVAIVFSSLLALQGILQYLFFNQKIFWIRELTGGGDPFGPYVNRNHYAGLMAMVFPVVLSIFLAYKPRVKYGSLRERLAELFSLRDTNMYILIGFASVLIATSLFLSLSRGGIVSMSLSMVVLGGLLSRGKTNRHRGIVIMAVFILIVLSVGWFGWEPIVERFEKAVTGQNVSERDRLIIWNDCKALIRDFPLTGTGFGSFLSVYSRYRTLPGEEIADHAHNDYIELLTDGGAAAFLLVGCFVLSVFYKSYKRFLTREESYSRHLYVGSFAGVIAILIHSMSDFNLHIGANGLYFFFLAGLTVSAANTRMRERLSATFLKPLSSSAMRFIRILVIVMFVATLLFNAGVLAGQISYSFIKDMRLDGALSEAGLQGVRNTANKASFFDPLEAKYRYTAGNASGLLANREDAMKSYREAILLDPLNGKYLQSLGMMYSFRGYYDKAEDLLKKGIVCDRMNFERYRMYVLWLLSQGRKNEALWYMKTSLAMSPGRTVEYITSMVLGGISDEEMRSALPERVEPYFAFGDYLNNIGREDAAGEAYRNALGYMKNEKEAKKEFFYKAYRFFVKKELFDEALSVMRQAKTFLPNDPEIRYTAGAAYEKNGMSHNALEEYKKALMLDPGQEEAQKRLAVLSEEKGL